MDPDLQLAVTTGGFTIAGALAAGIVGLVGSALRRRWEVADRQDTGRLEQLKDLRAERMQVYPLVLDKFNAFSDAAGYLGDDVAAGRKAVGDQDADVRDYVDVETMHELEVLIQRALLVADEEVAGLLRKFDDEVTRKWAMASRGTLRKEAMIGRETQHELVKAMRREVRPDR